MLEFVEGLIEAREQAKKTGCSVTLSIALDDPRANRLRQIAEKLLLPRTTIKNSGLITTTGIENSTNAEEFLVALRQELGADLMDELESDLRRQIDLKNAGKQGV